MTDKNETGQIFDLIPKIMGDIGHVGKDNVNSFQHYNFRGIDDVYNCVGPVLVKHKVFIVPSVKSVTVTQVNTSTGKPSTQIVMEVAYRFYAPDGSFVEAITVGEAMDTGDKAANKAMSDAMKYAVWQTFCIPTIGIDSEVDSHQQAPAPQQAPQAEPAPAPAEKPQSPLEVRKQKLFSTWPIADIEKVLFQLINPKTNEKFVKGEKITRMAELAELERRLNTGDIT